MDWEGREEESSNVDDRRGRRTQIGIAGGGVALLILLAGWFLDVDPRPLLDAINGGGDPQGQVAPRQTDPQEERMAKFSKVIFRSTEKVWSAQFERLGKHYINPTLVLYDDSVQSGCGNADSSVGPFYCGADQHVYLDLSFFREMETKFNAPGEFARAYVIAHEVGHHVQHQLGYSARAHELERSGQQTKNQASVRLELQADYFAGVWAYYAKDTFTINEADVKTAIHAAYEIGDDRLQQEAGRRVSPERFTHGTSKQRMHWFMEGYRSGDVEGAKELFAINYSRL